jgi:hypothetical protein
MEAAAPRPDPLAIATPAAAGPFTNSVGAGADGEDQQQVPCL